jgi:hypothetical protein
VGDKPNTTQRSWSTYQGKKPIKSWEKDGFYDGRTPPLPPEEPTPDLAFEEEEKKKRAFSRLRSAMEDL